VYNKCVQRHLRNGTTTAVYFATIHKDASVVLANACLGMGQRAFVGKVNMDMHSPDHYIETCDQSLKDTEEFIKAVLSLNNNSENNANNAENVEKKNSYYKREPHHLVCPIITPRFVPTCSVPLLKGLSTLATQYDLPIQSHVSENYGEIKWVRELHPECTYAEVYQQMGLLNDQTILAHGIFLKEHELELMAKTKATISHCPLSNFSLRSGVFDLQRAIKKGVNVALGTDVSGGYAPTMLNAIRNTMITSSSVGYLYRDSENVDAVVDKLIGVPVSTIVGGDEQESTQMPLAVTMEECFYYATVGGAEALRMGKHLGNFLPGKFFDALVIDLDTQDSPIDTFADIYSPHILYNTQQASEDEHMKTEIAKFHHYMQRFIFCGDDRNIAEIYVQGKQVHAKKQ